MDSHFDCPPSKDVPPCPTCHGVLERVYSRYGESVFVCIDCHTGISIPRGAWDIARVKKAGRTKPEGKAG